MVKRDPVKIFETPNYIKKTITVRPDKENQLFTHKQIRDYVTNKIKDLPKGAEYTVTGLNILRNSTLKMYAEAFMTDEEYEKDTKGKVDDDTNSISFMNSLLQFEKKKYYHPQQKQNLKNRYLRKI